MLIELAALGALAYSADKSNRMDEKALAKRSKAYTREMEAYALVNQKRSQADKKMQIVAKKKRAVIESTLPRLLRFISRFRKLTSPFPIKTNLLFMRNFSQVIHFRLCRWLFKNRLQTASL